MAVETFHMPSRVRPRQWLPALHGTRRLDTQEPNYGPQSVLRGLEPRQFYLGVSCFTQTRSYELFRVKGVHVPWSKAPSCRLHLRASLLTPRNEADVDRLTDAEPVESPPASAALSPTVPVGSTPIVVTPRRSYQRSTDYAADVLRRAAVLAMEKADDPVQEADGQDATNERQAKEGAVTRTTEDAGTAVGDEMEMEQHAAVMVNGEEENGAPAATAAGCEEQYETCDADVDLGGLGTDTLEAPRSDMQAMPSTWKRGRTCRTRFALVPGAYARDILVWLL